MKTLLVAREETFGVITPDVEVADLVLASTGSVRLCLEPRAMKSPVKPIGFDLLLFEGTFFPRSILDCRAIITTKQVVYKSVSTSYVE